MNQIKSVSGLDLSYILIELGSKAEHVWIIGVWNLVIVCFLSFGAWNLLNSRTLIYLGAQFDFFNIFVRGCAP